MKLSISSRCFTIIATVGLVFVNVGFAGLSPPESYSDLLKRAVNEAGQFLSGYELLVGASPWDLPGGGFAPFVEGLDDTNAVPFLLEVIKKGPPWRDDELMRDYDFMRGYECMGLEGDELKVAKKSQEYHLSLFRHIARCYAVLCLATTKDPNAFPVLSDLLENGKYLKDFDMSEKERQKYDIRVYAAAGLGILADANAVDLLISTLLDKNPEVRWKSIFALTKIGDTRTIKPILEAVAKDTVFDDFTLNECMQKMTKIEFESDYSSEWKERTFKDFPELGPLKPPVPYKKVWQHWLRVGKERAKEQFGNSYREWKNVKQTKQNDKSAVNHWKRQMVKYGIAALPFLIEKVKAGDTALIPVVSELTDRKVKENATKEEVLSWWNNNKQRWLIPFGTPKSPSGM